MNTWTFINLASKATRSGQSMSEEILSAIAQACELQMNSHLRGEVPGAEETRVSVTKTGRASQGKVLYFVDRLPDRREVAEHVPGAAYVSVSSCQDLFGPEGACASASHEILEDEGNPDCNLFAQDRQGQMHALERCDAVETQSYEVSLPSGQSVSVSNFLLPAWQDPFSKGPFTFMGKKRMSGAAEPPGPLLTARSTTGGNYQVILPVSYDYARAVFGKEIVDGHMRAVRGYPKKRNDAFHWSSRPSRILAAHNSLCL